MRNVKLINLFIYFFIFTTLLVTAFIIYKSEVVHQGSIRSYYKTSFYITLFFLIVLLIVNHLKIIVKKYFTIIFSILFVYLYILEGFISYKLHDRDNHISIQRQSLYLKITNKKFDNRTKIEVFHEMAIDNDNISLPLLPKQYLVEDDYIFPLSNVSLSKTVFCNENGYYSVYTSDRYGFNNPDIEWDNKNIQYLLLGDSAVHGACVNRPYDIASVIRKQSNKAVLNLGYIGNGPLLQLATLKEYISKDVKNVIWFYFPNDAWDLKRELNNIYLKKYFEDQNFKQNLKLKQNIIDKVLKKELAQIDKKNITESKIKRKIFDFVKLSNIRQIIQDRGLQPQFKEILKKTKSITKINNSNFYFVYLPRYTHVKDNTYDKNFFLIKKILSDLEIPLIDIKKELFDKIEDPLSLYPFNLNGHLNEKGYEVVGKTVYDYIQKLKF